MIVDTVYRLLRRSFYMKFRKDYVARMVAERKGVCGRHGCCDLTIFHKISNINVSKCLDKDDRTRCLRWPDALPYECRIYPFDEMDKITETRSYCSFYWERDGEGS